MDRSPRFLKAFETARKFMQNINLAESNREAESLDEAFSMLAAYGVGDDVGVLIAARGEIPFEDPHIDKAVAFELVRVDGKPRRTQLAAALVKKAECRNLWHHELLRRLDFNPSALPTSNYLRRNLIYHLHNSGQVTYVDQFLGDFSWWAMRFARSGPKAIYSDFEDAERHTNIDFGTAQTIGQLARVLVDSKAALSDKLRQGALKYLSTTVTSQWVWVVDANLHQNNITNWAADAVGEALAARGWGLVRGPFTPEVDYVEIAFTSAMERAGKDWEDYVAFRGDEVSDAVEIANAIVIIGGHADDMEAVVKEAGRRNIPVLPLAGTGGFAMELSRRTSRSEFEGLGASIRSPKDADAVAKRAMQIIAGEEVISDPLFRACKEFVNPARDNEPLPTELSSFRPRKYAAKEIEMRLGSSDRGDRAFGMAAFVFGKHYDVGGAAVGAALATILDFSAPLTSLLCASRVLRHVFLADAWEYDLDLARIDLKSIEQTLRSAGPIQRARDVHARWRDVMRWVDIDQKARRLDAVDNAWTTNNDEQAALLLGTIPNPKVPRKTWNRYISGNLRHLRLYAFCYLAEHPEDGDLDAIVRALISKHDPKFHVRLGLIAAVAVARRHRKKLSLTDQNALRAFEIEHREFVAPLFTTAPQKKK